MVEIIPTTRASDLMILLPDAGSRPRLSGPSGSARDLRPPGRGRKHNNGGAQPAQYAVFSAIVQGGGEILMVVESEQMAT